MALIDRMRNLYKMASLRLGIIVTALSEEPSPSYGKSRQIDARIIHRVSDPRSLERSAPVLARPICGKLGVIFRPFNAPNILSRTAGDEPRKNEVPGSRLSVGRRSANRGE